MGNLSRDWSQAFVDVALSPEVPQERALQALDRGSDGIAQRSGVVAGTGGWAADPGIAVVRSE